MSAKSPLRLLRSIREINQLSKEEAQRAYPVRLDGIATYSDPEWGLLFLQDNTGAIYVDMHGRNQSFSTGTRLRINAVTGLGDLGPVVVHPSVQVLGGGVLPEPRAVSIAELNAGVADSYETSARGVVRPGTQLWNRISFRLFDGSDSVLVMVPRDDPQAAARLVGATVRVQGVSGAHLDANRKRLGAQIFVPRLEDITVETAPPPDPSSLPPRPIHTIQQAEADQRFIHPVHVRGKVIWERRGLFFAEDDSGVICGQTGKETAIHPGDVVDIVGYPSRSDYGLMLTDAQLRTAGNPAQRSPVAPLNLTASQVLARSADRKLVHLEARLLDQSEDAAGHTFLLKDGRQRFRATLARHEGKQGVVHLPQDAVLELTGIALLRPATTQQPTSFLLLISSPGDVALLKPNAWLTLKRLLLILGGLAIASIMVLAWVTQLRRTVQRQTAIIRARLERELELENEYRRLFERNLAAVFRWQPDGRILDCNTAFAQMLGFDQCSDLIGRNYWEFRENSAKQELQHLAHDGEALRNYDAKLRREDGNSVWLMENTTLVHSPQGALYETTAIDITQLRQNEADLQRARDTALSQALNDPLTGLPNRRHLFDSLIKLLAAADRASQTVTVLYIDLDGFKLVNDSLGHSIGDALLAQVARRLQSQIAKADMLARLGGDEFTVIQAGAHSRQSTLLVAERLLSALTEPFFIEGHEIMVGASIGISVFPEHARTPEELLQHADSAMYAAKRSGKNRATVFTPELGELLRERLNLEHQLRGSLNRREISIHYQPEFDVSTNRLVRFEALARWTHHSLGVIPPAKFIPIAEESGFITILGAYVMEQACAEAVRWQSVTSERVQVAVNVSSIQFLREGFPEQVLDILKRTGLRPDLLQIELTESVMLGGFQRSAEVMRRLRELGVSLAIDDFGTGYSCLSHLHSLPFDALKIDRCFVKDLGERPEGEIMIQSVVALAHNIGMRVIVEGVENPDQLRVIEKLGGNEVQGYLLGRPTPNPAEVLVAQGRIEAEPAIQICALAESLHS